MNEEVIKLILDLGSSVANVAQVREELAKLKGSTKEAAEATDQATGATTDFSGAIKAGGRALKDFSEGGIGGVVKNAGALVTALGGPMSAAVVVTGLGAAALAVAPIVKGFFKDLTEGSNAVPGATDKLDILNESLAENEKRLGELRSQQKLTNAELAEYNELLRSNTELEAEANVVRERRNALEKARTSEGASDRTAGGKRVAELASERGGLGRVEDELYDRLVAFGDEDVLGLREELEAAKQAAKQAVGTGLQSLRAVRVRELEASLKAAETAVRDRAKEVLGGAVAGDETQIRNLAAAIPGAGFDSATPEGLSKLASAKAFGEESGQRLMRDVLDKTIGAATRSMRDLNADRKRKAEEDKKDKEEAELDRKWSNQQSQALATAEYQQGELQRKADEQAKEDADKAAKEAPKKAREAQLANISGFIDRRTGGQLPEDTLAEAAKSMQDLMGKGVNPQAAYKLTLEEVVKANQAMMARISQLEGGFFNIADQLRWQAQQNRNQTQTVGTRLRRGR